MIARVSEQRRIWRALQIASAAGVALTIACAIGLASEDLFVAAAQVTAIAQPDDQIALASIVLALTILRSLSHLWAAHALRDPAIESRRLAIAAYLFAVVAQCFAVASFSLAFVPILLAWPVVLAVLLARRAARWLVIADPPLPPFVILP